MALKRDWIRWGSAAIAVFVIVYILGFLPTPYVVYKPGLAEDVGPMVHVENADVAEQSVLMLTTVRQMYPNWAAFVYARFNPNWDIYKKTDIFREGETRSEYVERQQYVMLSSQSNAMQAAYEAAGVPFELSYEGVIVLRTIPGMPAAEKLLAGDRILTLNDEPVTTSKQLTELVSSAKVGERFTIGIRRDHEDRSIDVEIGDFAKLPDAVNPAVPQPGLGISPADRIAVKAIDPSNQVVIQVNDIGGPSAGLMFALEIYDQLTAGDLTKGYRIAGTGEIFTTGEVDAIGGVKHKVAAADREKADVFFTPQDNAKDAAAMAEKIDTPMKVVPVSTLQEAIDYLDQLPEKSAQD